MYVCVVIPFILDVRLVDVPAGVTQEEGHTGFLIHLPSAVLDLIFLARRIQLFGRSHRISHPPSFCGACLKFSREKDSTVVPFPRRP